MTPSQTILTAGPFGGMAGATLKITGNKLPQDSMSACREGTLAVRADEA